MCFQKHPYRRNTNADDNFFPQSDFGFHLGSNLLLAWITPNPTEGTYPLSHSTQPRCADNSNKYFSVNCVGLTPVSVQTLLPLSGCRASIS